MVARQLDHSTLPHWAPGPCRFLTQIPASTTDICYPRKRCDMGPNGFSVCSFLTLERPSRKTKYVYEKGQAPRRENVIQHHCSLWLQRWKERTRRNKASPAQGEQAPTGSTARREWQQAMCNQLASRAHLSPLHLAFRNISVLTFNLGCFGYVCNSQHMRPHWENPNH